MDIEFHYYITFVLASKAGLKPEEAEIIAYSSQYVDDNNRQYTIKSGREEYQNYISQTTDILKPKKKLIRIWPCFHFLPGNYVSHNDVAKRRDGLLHIFTTTPNSVNANGLMNAALKSGDPYRIGIATHTYADTWAHQNFVGYYHSVNSMSGLIEAVVPDIGHADAGHKPDIPNYIWKDDRLVSPQIHNKGRFIEAARNIFIKFSHFASSQITERQIQEAWDSLQNELVNSIGEEAEKEDRKNRRRIDNYKAIVQDIKKYNPREWFEQAIRTVKSRGASPRRGRTVKTYRQKQAFTNSHWYKFQEAVKKHQRLALTILNPIFEQIGFGDIANF